MRLIPRLQNPFERKHSYLSIIEAKPRATTIQATYGEKPTVPFSTLRNWYLSDPSVKAAIDDMVAQAVGPGFYVTCSTAQAKAKQIVDDFNAAANIDQWFQTVLPEVAYSGNSFTLKPDDWTDPPDFVEQIIPLSTVERAKRRQEGGSVTSIITGIEGREVSYPVEDLIHLAWNIVDRSAFGTGLLSPLATSRFDSDGNQVPSLLQMKADAEHDGHRILKKYVPRYLVNFEASDEAFRSKILPMLERLRTGEDIATNVKMDFKELTVGSRYDPSPLFDYVLNQVYIGLETPLMRLYTSPGFTEASARAAVEVRERFTLLAQRFLKRAYERQIAEPVLRAWGVDTVKADVRLNWGVIDVPTLGFQDVSRIYELGGMSLSEYRKNLRRFGVELFESSLDQPRSESDQARVNGGL
ncbi:MAG: hypothetical protein HYU39_04605 [Thaumarchaeota archaeon]|nr:hypothetical protein [Nitrososphaerota archaeon]